MGIHKLLVQMGFVIETIHVYGLGIVLRGGPGIVVSGRREPRRVFPVAKVREHLGNPPAGAVSLFPAFVADTPENHGRMVAVPVNHGRQVFPYPLLKELGIAVGLFGIGPGVREFVHHQEAHPVAEVQELRCGRVVAGADGVAAHPPEHLQAAHPGVLVPDGSQGSRIVMQANAFQEGLFSIQIEAVGLERNLPDAEGRLIAIRGAVLRRNGGAGAIQDRRGRAPKFGRRNGEFLVQHPAVIDLALGFGGGHQGIGQQDLRHNLDGLRLVCLQADIQRNLGLIPFQGTFHEGAPMGHGGGSLAGNPHVAVDAAAGIPAGALLLVVQLHHYLIVPFMEPGIQRHGPGGIAIGPAAGFLPVHQHLAVGHGAVNLQADPPFQVIGRYGERLTILRLSPPGQFARFSGVFLAEGAFHAPVVGQVQHAGFSVLGEQPALIPQGPAEGLRLQAQGTQAQKQDQGLSHWAKQSKMLVGLKSALKAPWS